MALSQTCCVICDGISLNILFICRNVFVAYHSIGTTCSIASSISHGILISFVSFSVDVCHLLRYLICFRFVGVASVYISQYSSNWSNFILFYWWNCNSRCDDKQLFFHNVEHVHTNSLFSATFPNEQKYSSAIEILFYSATVTVYFWFFFRRFFLTCGGSVYLFIFSISFIHLSCAPTKCRNRFEIFFFVYTELVFVIVGVFNSFHASTPTLFAITPKPSSHSAKMFANSNFVIWTNISFVCERRW